MELKPAGALDEQIGTTIGAYRKGTLTYTKLGLVLLFFFLLWGDFVLVLMELVIPLILPLQLKDLGASNLTMGILLSTLPSSLNIVVNPFVSVQSDRLRTRWGRRIPILLLTTPLVSLFLALLGFAPDIGARMVQTVLFRSIGLSPAGAVILVIAIILLLFQLFNYCLSPVYYYLFVDVVPDRVLGRFLSLFRIVAMLAGYLFNTYVFGHATTHMRLIYIGAAALYFVGFMTMCLMIREGKYPPPPPRHQQRAVLVRSVQLYFRECFSHPHYLLYNARNAAVAIGGLCNMYAIFLLRDSLHIPLDFIGKVNGWSHLVAAALLVPMGFITDWINPFRAMLIASLLFFPVHGLNFLFLRDQSSFVILVLLHLTISSLINASELPMAALVPPRERYGQFSSANAMVCALLTIVMSPIAGAFIDWTTAKGTIVANYRYCYLWSFGWQLLGAGLMILFYRSWRKQGGPHYYKPPT